MDAVTSSVFTGSSTKIVPGDPTILFLGKKMTKRISLLKLLKPLN
jgi:hypothetical protein